MNDSIDISGKILRQIVLEQSHRAHVGHIGSSLSIADIIAVLYGKILRIPSPEDLGRDRFILSKGHAALALFGALKLKGWITQEDLDSFCDNDSLLGVHPDHFVRGVDFSTGSLGQGMTFAVGAALSTKIMRLNRSVYVLVSDAELNEGSFWEAIMFAAQHRISNLVVIIDNNRQQAFGYTRDVLNLAPLADKFACFGFDCAIVDGHDENEIANVLNNLDLESGPPHIVIANTVFGKGVSFMESKIRWHYYPMSDDEYRQALDEVAGR